MFHLARPAPAKTSQKLHLRPKLILQVQRVSCNAHAMPVLELWRPGVFNYGVVKNSIPEAKLHAADQEDDVFAVIRKCKSRHKGNSTGIINFRGDHLVKVQSIEGHYQCTWEDANRGPMKMKACIPYGDGTGSWFTISDSTGVQVTLGRMEDRVISLFQQKECPESEGSLQSSLNVVILHVLAALIEIDNAGIW
ncbi:unnamed protein product [Penicillium crustosum]